MLNLDLKLALKYDLPELRHRMMMKYSMGDAETRFILQETIRWLWAAAKLAEAKPGAALNISNEIRVIDLCWHEFITFEKEYKDFCMSYLGRFIHLIPASEHEISERDALSVNNPEEATRQWQEKMKPQLSFLYDLLGPETVALWYQQFPKRFSNLKNAS